MYESMGGPELGLELQTLARMREVFGGHECVRCGVPAARLFGGRFYCHDHVPRKTRGDREERRLKVYRCLVNAEK